MSDGQEQIMNDSNLLNDGEALKKRNVQETKADEDRFLQKKTGVTFTN